MRSGKRTASAVSLVSETRLRVRFSEVDAMHIVWHGNYALYLEEGREEFGRRYGGLGYDDIAASGYGAPIVSMRVDYLSPLRRGDEVTIETRYIDTDAAKICFEYELRRGEVVVARAATVQVFTGAGGELELTNPAFYIEWKRRWVVR